MRGMTLLDYVDEAAVGHPRVVDRRRALQVLCYSPNEAPLSPHEALSMPGAAAEVFRLDVLDALAAMGVAPDPD